MRRIAVFLLLAMAAAVAYATLPVASVTLSGAGPGAECGAVTMRTATSGTTTCVCSTAVGALVPFPTHPMADSIIGFSSDRQMGVTKCPSSSTGTPVNTTITLYPLVHVRVSFWIISDGALGENLEAVTSAIGNWVSAANALYGSEHTGIVVELSAIHDATGTTAASRAESAQIGNDYPGGRTIARPASTPEGLGKKFGKDAGVINVYIFNTVNGYWGSGTAAGFGSKFVAISWTASADLLAHELGHNFYLPDCGRSTDAFVPACTGNFNEQNVMTHLSSSRMYVTEGETYWAEKLRLSTINSVFYHGRTDAIAAPWGSWNGYLPHFDMRIWWDGTLGP